MILGRMKHDHAVVRALFSVNIRVAGEDWSQAQRECQNLQAIHARKTYRNAYRGAEVFGCMCGKYVVEDVNEDDLLRYA